MAYREPDVRAGMVTRFDVTLPLVK